MSLPSLGTEDIDEEETQAQEEERESTPIKETSAEQMEERFDLTQEHRSDKEGQNSLETAILNHQEQTT